MNDRSKLLGLIWLLQFVNHLDRVNISVAAPSMMKSLSIDPGTFGFVVSAFTVDTRSCRYPVVHGGPLWDGRVPGLLSAGHAGCTFTGQHDGVRPHLVLHRCPVRGCRVRGNGLRRRCHADSGGALRHHRLRWLRGAGPQHRHTVVPQGMPQTSRETRAAE